MLEVAEIVGVLIERVFQSFMHGAPIWNKTADFGFESEWISSFLVV
jgi:hypothetical protein